MEGVYSIILAISWIIWSAVNVTFAGGSGVLHG